MENKSRVEFAAGLTAVRPDRGTVEISWTGGPEAARVKVFAGTAPDRMDRSRPVEFSDESEAGRPGRKIKVQGLDPGRRYYFEVVPPEGRGVVVAPRRVRFESTYNFRDLGGYGTTGGRRTRWGQVFRSDGLSRLTEADRAFLGGLDLRLIVDLRSGAEAEKAPDLLPEGDRTRYLHLSVQTGELNFVTAMERLKKGDADWLTEDYMVRGYIRNLEEFGPIWGRLLRTAAEPENRPLVFHCTGGKDRAGTAAALLLLALGVPEETVIGDHQLSNLYIAEMLPKVWDRLKSLGLDPEKVSPYFTAPLAGIEALLERLSGRYGSVESYLLQEAGLEPAELARLRQELLEPEA
ncbi:MAG: tyrosine-protein phosphatase [Thermodesulfobacteriota bacterium]